MGDWRDVHMIFNTKSIQILSNSLYQPLELIMILYSFWNNFTTSLQTWGTMVQTNLYPVFHNIVSC